MSDTIASEQDSRPTAIATAIASMCVAAVMNEIAEMLELRFAEQSRRTLHKHKDCVIHRKETIIPITEYDTIVRECLSTQLRGIYEKFYHNNRAFCVELASRVYATVMDGQPDDVKPVVVERFEKYDTDASTTTPILMESKTE